MRGLPLQHCVRAFLGLIVILNLQPAWGADWNQWRGPDRTGYLEDSPKLIDSLPQEGLQPVWMSGNIASARDGGWGSPVVAEGVVYLFSHKKELVGEKPGERKFPYLAPEKRSHLTDEEFKEYEQNRRNEDEARAKAYQFREFVLAYDAIDGKELWVNRSESTYSRFPQSGSPTVVDGRLFILGAGRVARCLDAKTGAELWREKLPGEFRDEYYQASVLVVDDIAIFNSGHLFGLSTQTGEIVWEGDAQKTKGTHASPVLWTRGVEKFVISIRGGGNTNCIDPKTGEVLWTLDSEGGNASPIVVEDKLLVYGNSRKKGLACYQLTSDGAEFIWRYQRITDKGSTPIVAGNEIYVQGERKLACLDLETGDQRWMASLDMANPQWGSPIAAGSLGFYAYDGLLAFQISPEDFNEVFIAQINKDYLLASEQYFRDKFGLDDNDIDAEARKQGLKKYQAEVGKSGPLKCSSPAMSNGRLYIRLQDRVVCYDLRSGS